LKTQINLDLKWTGVIGLMSGTSLDGLDCCYVEFAQEKNNFRFRNLQTKSNPYSKFWQDKLKNAFYLSASQIKEIDSEFGQYLGEKTNLFIKENQLESKVELVASHGHTVFHRPQDGITVQIGSGKVLHDLTKLNVINDFRILDVDFGGQGAPLVPVGDHYLFHEYDACLNLGGFSNISFKKNGQRIAFDISPCNLPLNIFVSNYFNLDFDEGGKLSASGIVIDSLLDELNALSFYKQTYPKSLGFEWLTNQFLPVVEKYTPSATNDILRTIIEHIAIQVTDVLNHQVIANVLVTGGGTYNSFLMKRISTLSKSKIVIPDKNIIEFKEALIFAFLGFLNLKNTINTFKSVTGAKEDSIGGKRFFTQSH